MHGNIDYIEKNAIGGWAWNPELPNQPATVILRTTEIALLRARADQFRPDLLEAGIGGGHHGFTMNLHSLSLPADTQLYCVVEGCATPLPFQGKPEFTLPPARFDSLLPEPTDVASIESRLKQWIDRGWEGLTQDETETLRQYMQSPVGAYLRKQLPRLVPWCTLMAYCFAILADGRVTTCCADPYGRNAFGNINNDDIHTIWQRYKRLLAGDLWELPHCRDCKNNEFQLISSGHELEQWMKTADRKHPHGFNLEPLTQCNYACSLCPSGEKRPNGDHRLNLNLVLSWLDSEASHLRKILLFNYGEPLLHTGLFQFIADLRKKAPKCDLALSTNGMLLNLTACEQLVSNHVNLITVSAHGAPGTESMLQYSRKGASYEQVLENIARLIALRDNRGKTLPVVQLKVVLFDWNDSDRALQQVRDDATALGLNPGRRHDRDGYFWVLDSHRTTANRASKRIVPGTERYRKMLADKELC